MCCTAVLVGVLGRYVSRQLYFTLQECPFSGSATCGSCASIVPVGRFCYFSPAASQDALCML